MSAAKSCQFSQTYVIARLVGNHVQQLLGILTKAHQAQQAAGAGTEADRIQVRVELGADCFAGVWAKHENDLLLSQRKQPMIEPGDVEAVLRQAHGRVVPDSFTHGTSEQRQRWFSNGLKSGTIAACNTFNVTQL